MGRKTANVVLGNAFDLCFGIVVDTHVARLSGRLGLTREADAGKIEQALVKLVPQSDWTLFSHLLIWMAYLVASLFIGLRPLRVAKTVPPRRLAQVAIKEQPHGWMQPFPLQLCRHCRPLLLRRGPPPLASRNAIRLFSCHRMTSEKLSGMSDDLDSTRLHFRSERKFLAGGIHKHQHRPSFAPQQLVNTSPFFNRPRRERNHGIHVAARVEHVFDQAFESAISRAVQVRADMPP